MVATGKFYDLSLSNLRTFIKGYHADHLARKIEVPKKELEY